MIKILGGILNLDDREQDVLSLQHIDAKNIRFYGGQNGLTAENIRGNFLIGNSNLPAGTNECVGPFYDQVKRRIIWFNRNSNGNSGIYQLLIQTGLVSQLFRCGVNSATDILNLSLDYPVHSAAIVYRTEGDGDLLYWTDGYNRPRYINLDTITSLSPFTSDMLNAAKNCPTRPVTMNGYLSDATITYNSVKNKLFQFGYRWVYKNGEKSTFSPLSIVPLPLVGDPNAEVSVTSNNYIQFAVFSPATEDYQKIEVVGRESNGTTWGDYFLIDSLDRDDYNIAVNSFYAYKFYNNGSYIFISPNESDLYFDWLPDKANTLELLNGNVLIYGGITDGYDNIPRDEINVSISAAMIDSSNFASACFKQGCEQRFGLVYFDDRGKTNGVISFITDSAIDTTDFSLTTPNYIDTTPGSPSKVPQISASIFHTPPTWATSYQWVRADLTPKFLQWVTMDYQSDNQYIYLGIENLVQFNAKSNFLPSYDPVQGDRVRILANVTADYTSVAFSTQQDFAVLGVVQRTMSSPASPGAFIKIQKPPSFPTPAYTSVMLIELYTPNPKLPDNQQLFFEWGQRYGIYESGGNRYHVGQIQSQTAVLPATFAWVDGDVYIKNRPYYLAVPIENNVNYSYLFMMDKNWNDYVPTASNSNGRAWVINENAKEEYNGVLSRWGGKYQSGTNINELNRFRPADFDEADRAKGDIRRYKARDRILRVFQDRGIGQYGIYARFIQNNEGVTDLVTTNEIITTNNIQYYQGQYGVGGYPTNLASGAIADYFTDITTGREVRLSNDGMTDLGLLYKGQFYLSGLVTHYNKELLRSNGSIAKVMKFWDSFENQCHTVLQAGSGGTSTVSDYNYSFNEIRNAFCSFYDFHPEWGLSADDIVYTWKNGQIYKHDNLVYRCSFYAVDYGCHLTVVFNDNLIQKKSWQALTEIASDIWECPVIYTNAMSYGTQRQQTSLTTSEFTKLEGNPSAAIKRDANSSGGKNNGGFMKGNYLAVKFQKQNAQYLINLSEVVAYHTDSPLTKT